MDSGQSGFCDFGSLPPELLQLILSFGCLHVPDLLSLRLVCSKFSEALDDSGVCSRLYSHRWPGVQISQALTVVDFLALLVDELHSPPEKHGSPNYRFFDWPIVRTVDRYSFNEVVEDENLYSLVSPLVSSRGRIYSAPSPLFLTGGVGTLFVCPRADALFYASPDSLAQPLCSPSCSLDRLFFSDHPPTSLPAITPHDLAPTAFTSHLTSRLFHWAHDGFFSNDNFFLWILRWLLISLDAKLLNCTLATSPEQSPSFLYYTSATETTNFDGDLFEQRIGGPWAKIETIELGFDMDLYLDLDSNESQFGWKRSFWGMRSEERYGSKIPISGELWIPDEERFGWVLLIQKRAFWTASQMPV